MDTENIHYYEPSKGHGLRHNPFNAIISPRPIGWISSRNAKGQLNLAPYSFFNAFNYDPPILGFASISWKDSVQVQSCGTKSSLAECKLISMLPLKGEIPSGLGGVS